MPRVTVAISTHDRAGLVPQAVESALAQTLRDLEVVVVDNGSTDGTAEALAPYREQIRYVRQENRGRAGGRNRAIAEARGDYIAFLDSDDLWLPDKLDRQLAAFAELPGAGLVHGHVEVVDEQGHTLHAETERHRRLWSAASRGGTTYARWALECRCFTSTVVVPREAIERVGAYDPEIGLEDLDLYLRIALEYPIVFLEGEPLARYRMHPGQTASEELARGQIQACRKHLALLDSRPGVPGRRAARRNLELALARCHHVLYEPAETRRAILRATRIDPLALARPSALRRLALSLVPGRVRAHLRRGLGGPEAAAS